MLEVDGFPDLAQSAEIRIMRGKLSRRARPRASTRLSQDLRRRGEKNAAMTAASRSRATAWPCPTRQARDHDDDVAESSLREQSQIDRTFASPSCRAQQERRAEIGHQRQKTITP